MLKTTINECVRLYERNSKKENTLEQCAYCGTKSEPNAKTCTQCGANQFIIRK